VCINAEKKLLMVLQGKPEEEKRWSVPSGRMEEDEEIVTASQSTKKDSV
jgi:aminoglycoside 6'-N-acetyltransferase